MHDARALFAGSFNPPHRGHLAIITRLAASHRAVHVVIGHNTSKRYDVSPTERKRLVEAMVRAARLAHVLVEVTDDYIWRLARTVRRLYRLQADPRYVHVSSSLVRQRCSVAARGDAGEALSSSDDLSDLVPKAIEADVRRAYGTHHSVTRY